MIARGVRDYAFVSLFCLLLNNVILVIADRSGASLGVSVASSFFICVIAGYGLHARISFRHSLQIATFARYVLAMSLHIPFAYVALWLWRDFAGWRIEYAAPLATLSTTAVNFGLCRFAVFGRRAANNSWVHP